LKLFTYAGGARRQVHWVFGRQRVMRREEGREAGSFQCERLRFSARIEPGTRSDALVLDFAVSPPARSRHKLPRVSSTGVLLPRQTTAPADSRWEQWR
jgi:hypothetical protein